MSRKPRANTGTRQAAVSQAYIRTFQVVTLFKPVYINRVGLAHLAFWQVHVLLGTSNCRNMAFSLEQWATDFELEEDTVQSLASKGFKSKRSISKLTADLIKKEFKGLIMGQQLLLIDAVAELNSPAHDPHADTTPGVGPTGCSQPAGGTPGSDPASDATPVTTAAAATHTEGLNVAEIMNLLQAGSGNQVQLDQTGKTLIFDPFSGGSETTHNTVYRDIRDYISLVPKHTPSNNAPEVFCIGSHEFCLKDTRPALDGINVAQYMEASLKILREMTLKDKLSVQGMLDYVNYVIKIATMSQSFQWQSVLKYDLEYRKAQAELNFRWGADNAYLMQVLLKTDAPKTMKENQNTKPASVPKVADKFDPRSGKPICRNWNKIGGCSLRNCNYAHICAICFHPSHNGVNHVTDYPPRQQVSHTPASQYNDYNKSAHYPTSHPLGAPQPPVTGDGARY